MSSRRSSNSRGGSEYGSSPKMAAPGLLNISVALGVFLAVASGAAFMLLSQRDSQREFLQRYETTVEGIGDTWSTQQHSVSSVSISSSSSDEPEFENRQLGDFREDEEAPRLPEPYQLLAQDETLMAYPINNATAPKRVALLVFGLQRSLFLTMPSIIKRVIRPLTDVGYEPTVFVHQFDEVGHDKQSEGVPPGDWWSLLKPFDYTFTSQREFLNNNTEALDACEAHGTGWVYQSQEQQAKSIDNLACQLKSVEEVGNLWEMDYVNHKDEYAAVAYIRPDVQYQCDFPVHLVPRVKEGQVYVPDFANHMGMNDRFALLHPESGGIWKRRLKHALRHCVEEPIHSETFARQFAAENDLEVLKLPVDFVFFRVRPDGTVADPDYLLPGYNRAKFELAGRQQKIREGLVGLPPMDAHPKSHTWKQTKGSVAYKARQKHEKLLRREREQGKSGPPSSPLQKPVKPGNQQSRDQKPQKANVPLPKPPLAPSAPVSDPPQTRPKATPPNTSVSTDTERSGSTSTPQDTPNSSTKGQNGTKTEPEDQKTTEDGPKVEKEDSDSLEIEGTKKSPPVEVVEYHPPAEHSSKEPSAENSEKPTGPKASKDGDGAAPEKKNVFEEKRPQRDISPDAAAWDNSIAVCAIMKEEKVPDIREWLLYHKWLGVDKIYLRENKNTTGVSDIYQNGLQDLINSGFLNLGTWSGQSPQAQQLWYNRCAEGDLAGAQAWILFSDLDEFPVLLNGGVAQEEPDLKAFMRRQRGAAGLSLQWVMFGSSGLRDRPAPGGPLRHFDKCSNELSFEMKCFAASHYLADTPFIHPYFIHACCYKYKEGDNPRHGAAIRYGDGKRKTNLHAKPSLFVRSTSPKADVWGLVPSSTAPQCRTYEGHLQKHEYTDKLRAIPQGEALVLFHYMTRSFQDFRERKLSRYAGMYVDDFKERRAAAVATGGAAPADEALFDDLEHDLGIDIEAPVCLSAADANYTARCCE